MYSFRNSPPLLIHKLLHDYIHPFIFINLPKCFFEHPVSVLINAIMKIIVVILCAS